MIAQYLNRFMDIYLDNQNRKVDKDSEDHKLICSTIPQELKKDNVLKQYYIKGSDGAGQKTFYPWVCLMNETITRSPQKGLYIAILFKKNMKGFYIALNQGITFFKEKYKSKAYEKAKVMADYFRDVLGDDLGYVSNIDLGGIKNDNGFGYEKTTIVAKEFDKDHFNDDDLFSSLSDLSNLYNEIIATMEQNKYEKVIPSIVGDESDILVDANTAIDEINDALYSDGKKPIKQSLLEVVPKIDKPRFNRISRTPSRKIDYVKRAEEDAKTGLRGEKFMLDFELDRLQKIGLEDYVPKQVSVENDVLGYDILSYDKDDKGKVHEIYIEVKTTSAEKDSDFFISKNEVNVSNEKSKHYWIYRVYNCTDNAAEIKFYRVNGTVEQNFILDAATYKAHLKEGANIVSSAPLMHEFIYNKLNAIVSK